MIEGRIDAKFEAVIDLDVRLGDELKRESFLVDTGFNGFIAVPQKLVDRLGLFCSMCRKALQPTVASAISTRLR